MLNQNQTLLLLVIIIFLLLLVIVVLLTYMKSIKSNMEQLNRVMYAVLRKDEKYDNSHADIKRALTVINGNIGSLSSSTDQIHEEIKEVVKSNDKVLKEFNTITNSPIMPTPNITKMMRDTILENINIEVLLSKGMKIPNKKSTEHIIDNTIAAYPNVNHEYTIKLCLAMIENFAMSVNEGSTKT